MPQHSKDNILAGRNAVDDYRTAHAQLHSEPWQRGVPEEHTPLLNAMLKRLKGQGFNSLTEFFDASQEQNMQELGFKDRQDFEEQASEKDREALEGMWH